MKVQIEYERWLQNHPGCLEMTSLSIYPFNKTFDKLALVTHSGPVLWRDSERGFFTVRKDFLFDIDPPRSDDGAIFMPEEVDTVAVHFPPERKEEAFHLLTAWLEQFHALNVRNKNKPKFRLEANRIEPVFQNDAERNDRLQDLWEYNTNRRIQYAMSHLTDSVDELKYFRIKSYLDLMSNIRLMQHKIFKHGPPVFSWVYRVVEEHKPAVLFAFQKHHFSYQIGEEEKNELLNENTPSWVILMFSRNLEGILKSIDSSIKDHLLRH